jgi:hypothetical protein
MSGRGRHFASGLRWSLGYNFACFAWEPEGIVLTPHTVFAQYGYGFPKRDRITGEKINAPFGTLLTIGNEALNQCLINRFINNKYLDRFEYISGISEDILTSLQLPETNSRLRESATAVSSPKIKIVYWPLGYEPTASDDNFWEISDNRTNWPDVPGINRWTAGYNFSSLTRPTVDGDGNLVGELPNRQFDADREALIYESEDDDWYCHWPEELLYDNDAYEAIFQETNVYRAEVGREPVSREIRGFVSASRMILSEVQRAQVMFHENEELYRNGYGTVEYRLLNGGVFSGYAENLFLSASASGFSAEAGVQAALGWRESPLHYANMISSTWDEPAGSTSLDVFGNVAATITEKGSVAGIPSSLDESYDPPVSGKAWAQLFVQHQRWLYAGYCEHRTSYGVVTTTNYFSPVSRPYQYENGATYCYYKGRPFFIKPIYDAEQDKGAYAVNQGTIVFMHDGLLCFRVIFSLRDPSNENAVTVYAYRRPVYAAHDDWELEYSIRLGVKDIPFISCFWFSFDGNTAFSLCSELLTDDEYTYYFTDLPSDSFPLCPAGQRILNFNGNSGFSFGDIINGPDITYTVSAYDEPNDKYNYKQEGSGTVNILPFVDLNGNTRYIGYEMDLLSDQKWTSATEFSTEFSANDTIIFASGKRLQIKKINFSGSSDIYSENYYTGIDDNYFINFLYFNPITEDVSYIKYKIDFVNSGGVGLAIQADVYYNNELLKSYPSVDLTTDAYTVVRSITKQNGSYGDVMHNILCVHKFLVSFGVWAAIPVYFNMPSGGSYYIEYHLDAYPTRKFYVAKTIVGTYPASYSKMFSTVNFYVEDTVRASGTHMIHGYEIGIPVNWIAFNEGYGYSAKYKDKVASQFYVGPVWGFTSSSPTVKERTIIDANFLLEDLVGIGELTDIRPLGVIYE